MFNNNFIKNEKYCFLCVDDNGNLSYTTDKPFPFKLNIIPDIIELTMNPVQIGIKISSKIWEKYLHASDDCYSITCTTNSDKVGINEVFKLCRYTRNSVGFSLITIHGYYITVDTDGRVIASLKSLKDCPNGLGEFEIRMVSLNDYVVKCVGLGYLFAEPDGRVLGDGKNVGAWERLDIDFVCIE